MDLFNDLPFNLATETAQDGHKDLAQRIDREKAQKAQEQAQGSLFDGLEQAQDLTDLLDEQ